MQNFSKYFQQTFFELALFPIAELSLSAAVHVQWLTRRNRSLQLWYSSKNRLITVVIWALMPMGTPLVYYPVWWLCNHHAVHYVAKMTQKQKPVDLPLMREWPCLLYTSGQGMEWGLERLGMGHWNTTTDPSHLSTSQVSFMVICTVKFIVCNLYRAHSNIQSHASINLIFNSNQNLVKLFCPICHSEVQLKHSAALSIINPSPLVSAWMIMDTCKP